MAQKLTNAKDRNDFVAIRDEIKKMPPSEEKSKLIEIYTQKYHEWSADPSRPDIRMQYMPERDGTETPVANKTTMLERVTANFKTTTSFGLNDKPEEPTVKITKKSPVAQTEGVKVENPTPEIKEDKPVAQINTGASEMQEAEMIKRYNELQVESQRTGVVSEELLARFYKFYEFCRIWI